MDTESRAMMFASVQGKILQTFLQCDVDISKLLGRLASGVVTDMHGVSS